MTIPSHKKTRKAGVSSKPIPSLSGIIPTGQSQPCFYHTHEISRIIAYLTDDCFYQVFRRPDTFAKNPSSPTAKIQTQGFDSFYSQYPFIFPILASCRSKQAQAVNHFNDSNISLSNSVAQAN
jgi:hypothetical protein